MKSNNCKIIEVKECDTVYKITYTHKCDNCGYLSNEEHSYFTIMKNGLPINSDSWVCPHCNSINDVEIII